MLEELVSCTIWHFKHEKRLMLKHDSNEFADHKNEHEMLIESSMQHRQKFIPDDRQLSNEEIEFLEVWLTTHILTTDMRLGEFLNSAM